MSRRGQEQAMASLLANSGSSSITERPSQLTLPDTLHHQVLDVLQDSQDDGRERSIGFNYLRQRWVAGSIRVGEADQVKLRHPHRFRPNIRMHTHPRPNMEREALITKMRAIDRGWSQSQIVSIMARDIRAREGYFMLPSAPDVELIYARSTGTVGNMIASTGGIFFSVRDDLEDKESFGSSYWATSHEAADAYDLKLADAVNMGLSTKDTTAFVLNSAAQVLAHKYTCYFGENPENPMLTRADVQLERH